MFFSNTYAVSAQYFAPCTHTYTLATHEGRNPDGSFAARSKRRLSIMASRSMMQQAHYALRKHLRNDLQDDDDEVYSDDL